MINKQTRILYITVVVLLFSTAIGMYAYREFHRTKPSAAEQDAARSVTAEALLSDFTQDHTMASQKNAGQLLQVTGILKQIDSSNPQMPVIVLGEESSSTSLRFSLDSSYRQNMPKISTGTSIKLKGYCTGYQPDEFGLGADILFDRSFIVSFK